MNTSLWLKFFVTLAVVSASSLAHGSDCESMFKSTIRASAGDYIRTAQVRANGVKPPQFANPAYEQKAQVTWSGVLGPKLIQDYLVPGTSLISHSLRGANEPGVVKTTTGNMVHLRADIAGEATNIGVSYNALKENLGRKVKSYVRDNAVAVVLFIHGGGSNTTGHHVGANIMDFLNPRSVDVISIDLKWHGEGSRNSPESVRQELEILRQYVRVLTGNTKKPIFLAGHSMGGVIADLYMRHFPNDDLFAGVMSLSTVADSAPGQSLAVKREREAAVERQNQSNEMIPADERNLGAMLARQGKISPTCGFYCDVMMTGVDWTMPVHQGADYIPALYVIGRGDALYQGNEAAFTNGVAKLKNVEFVVFEQRRDIKAKDGQKMTIGHLIFDHKPLVEFSADVPLETQQKVFEGKIDKAEFERLRADGRLKMEPQFTFEDLKSPEIYARIRNFISRVAGRELPKVEPSRDPLDDVVQEYLKNLAFREFAKSHSYLHRRATQAGAEL
ncbi:MAG: alpha/beta fold hydrolase, partial [Bdellovibrionales bacterium]|nr:alpha/beta fold hydrolase [Bdellovibrionales bacterium]